MIYSKTKILWNPLQKLVAGEGLKPSNPGVMSTMSTSIIDYTTLYNLVLIVQ